MVLVIHTSSEVTALLNGIKMCELIRTSLQRVGTQVLKEKPEYCGTRPPGSRRRKRTKSSNMIVITIVSAGGRTSVLKPNVNNKNNTF